MYSFGKESSKHRATCHPKLQGVLDEAIKHFDFSIIWGHRGREDQEKAYREGFSTVRWPNSKHNHTPSRAFDVVPYPGGFKNPDRTFYEMATYILRAANSQGVRISWGGHWKSFKDLAHFELVDEET